MEVTPEGLARFCEVVMPHMNERQRRVVAGAAAEMLGRGGKTAVASASGMSRNTVIKAQAEVEGGGRAVGASALPWRWRQAGDRQAAGLAGGAR